MDISKPFIGFFRKSTNSTSKEDIGQIKDTYYYRLNNISKDELILEWKDNSNHSSIRIQGRREFKGDVVKNLSGKVGGKVFQGQDLIKQLVYGNQITFEPLEIEKGTRYKVSNRTSKRISIKNFDTEKASIDIPPFASRWKVSEELKSYDFLDLQKQNQIQIEHENQIYETEDQATLKSFIDWLKNFFTKDINIIGRIKDNYYYQLYNTTDEDLELTFPSINGKEKTPKKLSAKNKDENTYDIQVFKGSALKSIGKQTIQDMYDNYLINLVPLDLEVNTNYKISNLTAKEIVIASRDKATPAITIPPFGTRFRISDNLRWCNFLELRDQEQIQIERKEPIYNFWDWFRLRPLASWLKKLLTKDSDVIGTIKDNYYYRLYNKTASDLELPMPPSKDGSINKPYILPASSSPKNKQVYSGVVLNTIGKKKILDLVNSNLVDFQPLEIKMDTNYIITNRTEQRIGILNYNKRDHLILPPLGTRLINSDKLRWYEFLEWYWQDLIRIEPEDQSFLSSENLSRIWDWIKVLPGLVLVALAGFGIPLWIVYHFGGGESLLNSFLVATGKVSEAWIKTHPVMPGVVQGKLPPDVALNILGRIFQVSFICIASILPALFYYLFGRQQVEKLRERFFRDVLILDPHLYSLSEAEAKYDTLLNSAFGSGSSSSPFAILLLIFSTTLLVVGWTITLTPYGQLPPPAISTTPSLIDFFQINAQLVTLGFLGVYFFSINMIYRRYVRADLTPKTYASIIVRLLVSLVLVFTIGLLESESKVGTGLLAVAFIIGVFPEDGFRFIRDFARKVPGFSKVGGEEKYPLTELEGMNQYDQARLLEEGIDNIENLAHHNLIELLAFTRIPTARLVDMFDQAILYLHLGIFDNEAKGKPPEGKSAGQEFQKFLRSLGVRTATDLMELLKAENIEHTKISIGSTQALFDKKYDFSLSRLKTIEATFRDDEWLSFVMNWRKESAKQSSLEVNLVTDPSKFYQSDSAILKNFGGAVDLPDLNFEVVQDWVNVREGPGLEYKIIERLKKGSKFTGKRLHSPGAWVEHEPNKWCALTYNLEAYMRVIENGQFLNDIKIIDGGIPLPNLQLQIINKFVRLRDRPDTSAKEVGQLNKDDRIKSQQMFAIEAWIEVGKNKWIAMIFEKTQYLKFLPSVDSSI